MAFEMIAATNLVMLRENVFFKFSGLKIKRYRQRDRTLGITEAIRGLVISGHAIKTA